MEKNMILDAKELGISFYEVHPWDEEFEVDLNSKRAIEVQQEANQAWQQVYVTDFYNVEEVIDLFYNLQTFGDNIYVDLPLEHLYHVLTKHGYQEQKYDESVRWTDKQVVGRYLIGRFMCYMKGEYLGVKGLPNAIFYDSKAYKEKFVA